MCLQILFFRFAVIQYKCTCKGTQKKYIGDVTFLRNKQIHLRLTEREYDMISGKATTLQMGMSEFVRYCCQKEDVPYTTNDNIQIEGQLSIADYAGVI